MGKSALAIDFDGVLHSYTSGWKGHDCVPDVPTLGAREFIAAVTAGGYEPIVHSSRASSPAGRAAVKDWLRAHGFPPLEVTQFKPAALVYIDDRAWRFEGRWPTPDELTAAALPWTKR